MPKIPFLRHNTPTYLYQLIRKITKRILNSWDLSLCLYWFVQQLGTFDLQPLQLLPQIPGLSTYNRYNPICTMYNPIYNQL